MRALGHSADRGQAAPLARAPPAARGWRPRPAADRYSRRVALLKRVLPAVGVTLLLLVAAWPRLSPLLDSVRLDFAAIDLREARELKMLNPRYAGIDRLNRPYVVTAAVGRQVPDRSDLMSLEQPRAVMIVHGGAKVVLTAATGIYQSQTQLLDLFGDVTMAHQNGTRFVTRRAHADFSDNTAEGHDPIEGHGPSGDIWGQGFRSLDKGDIIVFTGRSHLVLKGGKPGKAATPPPALPPAIAKTAAQVEAAAEMSAAARPAAHWSAAAAKPAHAKPAASHHRAAAKPHPHGRPIVKSHVVDEPAKRKPAAGKVEGDAG
jgi:lipopolysaccharide export system protein LptC